MAQLLTHILGDYFLQSDWMALNKNKSSLTCLIHCLTYTACFLLLTTSWKALLLIGGSHFLIDRFGLVRYVIWLKNWQSPNGYAPWPACSLTGYFDQGNSAEPPWPRRPLFITVWLYIISDNAAHLACNWAALQCL